MTQCNKQFDWGEEFAHRDYPDASWVKNREVIFRADPHGTRTLAIKYFHNDGEIYISNSRWFGCGHYRWDHKNCDIDLINVDEEGDEIKELARIKKEINELAALPIWLITTVEQIDFAKSFIQKFNNLIKSVNK